MARFDPVQHQLSVAAAAAAVVGGRILLADADDKAEGLSTMSAEAIGSWS